MCEFLQLYFQIPALTFGAGSIQGKSDESVITKQKSEALFAPPIIHPNITPASRECHSGER